MLAIRIKGFKKDGTTPQAQKILSEMGLRQINNAVFLRANPETLRKIAMTQDYITYGYPTKKVVNELVRKRGFLRKELKKEPITNNVLIEELFEELNKANDVGCICIEDVIDGIANCHKTEKMELFDEINKILWPM